MSTILCFLEFLEGLLKPAQTLAEFKVYMYFMGDTFFLLSSSFSSSCSSSFSSSSSWYSVTTLGI